MESLLYAIVGFFARVHNSILSWNDSIETSFTDKELHFLVIGLLGIVLICIFHPLFLWLSRKGHTMVVSFLYVFTVIVTIAFAIEIGQGATGTGSMEFDDIMYGVVGFLFFFLVFLAIRGVVHFIIRRVDKHRRKKGNYYA